MWIENTPQRAPAPAPSVVGGKLTPQMPEICTDRGPTCYQPCGPMPISCSSCTQENKDGAKFCLRCGSALEQPPGIDPLIGTQLLGRYRILRPLGEGGMGRVYLAEQQMGTATRLVAIKVLHTVHSRDATLRQRFHRECEVVIGLSHPNTIHFHDFGELPGGSLFIVMEYVDGPSLRDVLLAGPIALPRVERLLSQIASSLQDAHDRSIVHRDLKPENILLATRGGDPDFVKVCDFGIAKRHDAPDESSALTLQGTLIGTPQYMSPEQLGGDPVDARSDIYSLGLILYEMLAGRRPFEASSPMEWAARHMTADPPPFSEHPTTRNLPAAKAAAVMRSLEKLPSARQQSARELASEFLERPLSPISDHAFPRPVATTASNRDIAINSNVDVTAPTLAVTPGLDLKETTRPAARRPPARLGKIFFALAAISSVAALGISYPRWKPALTALIEGEELASTDPVLGPGTIDSGPADAGSDSGPEGPSEWIRIVHFQRAISDAASSLGAPDGHFAVVRPRGTITLELIAGTQIATDDSPGPDFSIVVDDARSGPYRADVGIARNRFTTVGSELVGSLALDADQFEIDRIRYIRIKNRGRRNVYLDAVGAYRTVTN